MPAQSKVQAQLAKARQLIENKQYTDARKILIKIDDPTARRWIEQLDTKYPMAKAKKKHTARNVFYAIIISVIVTLAAFFYIDEQIVAQHREASNNALETRSAEYAYWQHFCYDIWGQLMGEADKYPESARQAKENYQACLDEHPY